MITQEDIWDAAWNPVRAPEMCPLRLPTFLFPGRGRRALRVAPGHCHLTATCRLRGQAPHSPRKPAWRWRQCPPPAAAAGAVSGHGLRLGEQELGRRERGPNVRQPSGLWAWPRRPGQCPMPAARTRASPRTHTSQARPAVHRDSEAEPATAMKVAAGDKDKYHWQKI